MAFLFGSESRAPLYVQLKNQLLKEIQGGSLAPGQMIPSERLLQQEHRVSRATVRQAIGELVAEGVLERRQGVGTSVARRKIAPLHLKLTSFSDEMSARGLRPGSVVIEMRTVTPSPVVRERLGLDGDEPHQMVYRLRLADDEAISLQRLYVPPWLGLSAEELHSADSYYGLLARRHAIDVVRAHEYLNARNANGEEARLLRVRKGAALINVERVAYDAEGRPVEYVEIVYRGDRYTYDLTLYR